MTSSAPPSDPPSRTSTPSRFTAQSSTAEDLLKSQTVGLVHLSDFRKRRAEALEQKQREAQNRSLGRRGDGAVSNPGTESGATAPGGSDGGSTRPVTKKRKKKKKEWKVAAEKLSFGVDDEEEGDGGRSTTGPSLTNLTNPTDSASKTPDGASTSASDGDTLHRAVKKRLGPNAAVKVAPKALTKAVLTQEAATREQLRREFLAMQDAIKATEILMPFVFYDGANIPGGVCRVKKGDHTWLFLDKARKVGAELGVGGGSGLGEKAHSRREWARVGVDDLMLVRGEVIIPHHYDFYYFIVNKTRGPSGGLLFDYSAEARPSSTASTPSTSALSTTAPILTTSAAGSRNKKSGEERHEQGGDDKGIEGAAHDPNMTKVVDRRWYERNKHIFPASVWEEFEPERDYGSAVRRDPGGNAFFF